MITQNALTFEACEWYANRMIKEIIVNEVDEVDNIKMQEMIWYYKNKHVSYEHLDNLINKLAENEYYRAASQIQKILKQNESW